MGTNAHEEGKGEDDQEAKSKAGRATPLWGAGGVQTGSDRSLGSWGSGGGRDRHRGSGDRRFSDPGARREARQDPAPQHRGARGWTAAREGVGRRAGANSTPRRVGAAIVNSALSWSAQHEQKEGE